SSGRVACRPHTGSPGGAGGVGKGPPSPDGSGNPSRRLLPLGRGPGGSGPPASALVCASAYRASVRVGGMVPPERARPGVGGEAEGDPGKGIAPPAAPGSGGMGSSHRGAPAGANGIGRTAGPGGVGERSPG